MMQDRADVLPRGQHSIASRGDGCALGSSLCIRVHWRSFAVGFLSRGFGKNLEAALAEQIAQEQFKREPCWTEGLAVGSAGFLERIRPLILSRQETELVPQDSETWILREAALPYGAKTSSKSSPKGLN